MQRPQPEAAAAACESAPHPYPDSSLELDPSLSHYQQQQSLIAFPATASTFSSPSSWSSSSSSAPPSSATQRSVQSVVGRGHRPLHNNLPVRRVSAVAEPAAEPPIMSSVQQQKRTVDQLRREAGIKRIPVSQAADDLKKFIHDHEQEDCLLVGFHSQKANPFREKSSCLLL